MPSLEQAIQEKERLEQEQKEREAAAQTTEAQRKISEQLGYYDRLMANEDWKWFMDNVVSPAIRIEHDSALDVKKTPEVRNDHAQRHDLISKFFTSMETTRMQLRSALRKLTEP